MGLDVEAIKAAAIAEIEAEDYKEAVKKAKEKLRAKKSLLDLLFPFKIIIVKKGDTDV
jgi:hypothetical protein